MQPVVMYCTAFCPYCTRAERLLKSKGAEIEKIDVSSAEKWQEMETRTNRFTVPQIYIGDVHVGGYDDTAALDMAGKLDPLLSGEITEI